MPDEDRNLLAKIAWLYYMDGLTQKEIGERLSLSRLKVVRLLQRARSQGIVEIRIAADARLNVALSRKLEEHFELHEAVVIDSLETVSETREQVGKAGALILERLIEDGQIIGVGMGRTLSSMLNFMQPRRTADVIVRGIAGSYEVPGRDESAFNISWRLADLLDADIEQLYCPMIVADAETRSALLKDRELSALVDRIPKSDLALIGIGALDDESPLLRMSYLDDDSLQMMKARSAVGEIMGRFFSIEGEPVESPLDDRMIGITIDQLCGITKVLALTSGPSKIEPLIGALNSGCVNILITDYATADSVITRIDLQDEIERYQSAMIQGENHDEIG